MPVELLGLREEQRLARKVDAVAENVGRRADLGGAGEEAVDLLAPRPERHRAVQHRDLPRMQLVQLAGEPDHGAAAERDDHRAGAETDDAAAADPVERRLALEEAHLDVRERVLHERQRFNRAEQQDVPVLAAEHEPCPRRAALLVLGPLHLVSAVQHTIGASGLTRSSPVTRPTRSSPISADSRRCASCASIRSGAAYTPRPFPIRKRSASCVLPELVGPRCAITVSGSTLRSGSRTVKSAVDLRGACLRWCRWLRLGRFWRRWDTAPR